MSHVYIPGVFWGGSCRWLEKANRGGRQYREIAHITNEESFQLSLVTSPIRFFFFLIFFFNTPVKISQTFTPINQRTILEQSLPMLLILDRRVFIQVFPTRRAISFDGVYP